MSLSTGYCGSNIFEKSGFKALNLGKHVCSLSEAGWMTALNLRTAFSAHGCQRAMFKPSETVEMKRKHRTQTSLTSIQKKQTTYPLHRTQHWPFSALVVWRLLAGLESFCMSECVCVCVLLTC